MTIKIADITNLRVEADSDRKGTINFEAGDRRFHIWVRKTDDTWSMEHVIHSNPIEGSGEHRELSIMAETHAKLRTFLAKTIGDLNIIMPQAVELMIEARENADREHSRQLAENIREALNDRADRLPLELTMALRKLDDYGLIQLRGACYSAKFPDQTYPSGVLGIALTKQAA